MNFQELQIELVFNPEDQAWMRRNSLKPPKFWQGHAVPPLVGDILRMGGRQFVVQARVWDHDGMAPQLRLFLGDAQAPSDTTFG